ncbi:interferon-induced protein 44-like isoform X4 [Crassostrea virginica]
MPDLLKKAYKDQLVTWIGKPCHFRLLYKISRDGCSAQTFHQKCDNTNNTIFGGYLSQSWNSNGAYINDYSAFLFRLQYNGSSSPLTFPVSQPGYAGYGNGTYGPTFGSGHDIQTFNGTIYKSAGNYFHLNGYFSLGNSYNLNGQNNSTIANGNVQVTDLEVYGVMDGAEQQQTNVDKPWREQTEWTEEYRQYKIKDRSLGKFLNFRLCDSRGFEEDFSLDSQEISFILDGNIPDRYQFNPMVPFTPDTPGYIKNPDLESKIHCVAFVIDGSTADVIPEKILKQIKDLQIRMNQRGLPLIVLLTKLDKICPDVNDDVTNTFTSSAVCDAVEKVADIMGLPRAHVLPVKNYESETKLKTGVNILLMEAVERCLDFADDFMDDQLYTLASEEK